MQIRLATPDDAAAVRAIYQPYVQHTPISFEAEVPGEAEMAQRIAKAQTKWCWLVAEVAGRVIGYAYAGAFAERAAYGWSTTVSVYVAEGEHRRGVGRALYTDLLARLAALGYCRAFAGITQPNLRSVGLHMAVGFVPVGTYHRVGWKFGAWHDVAWFERSLREGPPPMR